MIWPYSGLFGLYDFENGKRWRHMNFYFQLILKSPKNYENLGFLTSGLCLAFKIFFGLFFNFPDLQMSWIFQIIQIWIILKQFCHQIIFAEKFANRISVTLGPSISKTLGPSLNQHREDLRQRRGGYSDE